MIKESYFKLGIFLAFVSPIPASVAAHFFGIGSMTFSLWVSCVVCMVCVEKGMKKYVAYEVYRAEQEVADLRRLFSLEKDALEFEKRKLIEQCQMLEGEKQKAEERVVGLEKEKQKLEEKVEDFEDRFVELKKAAEIEEELEALRDPAEPRRLSGGELSLDDLMDKALYGHL